MGLMNQLMLVSRLWLGIFLVWTAAQVDPLFAAPRPGFNYDENKVAPYTLPNLLEAADGTRITSVRAWRSQRRPEIFHLFETQVFGRTPTSLPKPKFEVFETDRTALGGKATRRQVGIWLARTNGGPRLDLLMYIPNDKKPAPAFIGLNFGGNHTVIDDPAVMISTNYVRGNYAPAGSNRADETTRGMQASRWPIEKLIDNGFAVVTAYYGDVEPDHPEGWKTGVRGWFAAEGADAVFAPDQWGAISAWAWGLSRAMDYLVTDSRIDSDRVAVIGHSRLGKTALWAGARDQRFAVVISNNSGEGGASLARRNFGETVERINTAFPHWFCGNYKKYNSDPSKLPVDAHMLIALAAPRPVYVASAQEDLWADPRGEFLSAINAEPVYRLYRLPGMGVTEMPPVNNSVGDYIGYHIRTGPHNITEYDWDQYIRFVSKHWAEKR
jgi:hypothetical protein